MVFLEELNNQQQQATSGSGTGGGGGGGGGGATFLSDEETNASDTGSTAFAPPPPHHHPPPPSNLSGSPNPAATNSIKGKGKAIEGSPPTATGDETISATTTTTSTTKKKPVKSKKQTQLGPDGKPIAPRERKKKAGRACAACQKAHLTCDDGRPCKRCIKKGCPDDCVDGARKKAKYLQEVPDERASPLSLPRSTLNRAYRGSRSSTRER